jgi:arabinofuranosyltransferase
VYNAGERVEVFTSPAWVAVLWLFSSLLPGVALEWVAVGAGILAAAFGFLASARGAWLLWCGAGRRGVAVPVGLLVLVAVRPVWDFATSGLDIALCFAWLGACFWALTTLHFAAREQARLRRLRHWVPGRLATWVAVLIGFGPLVRPDLGIYSAGFLVLLLVARPAPKRAARLRLVLWAALVPCAYELFRMGYYAALEPNTALAKEAGQADWLRGLRYLKDFVLPYYLFIPVGALLGAAAYELRGSVQADRRIRLFMAVPLCCAALHAIYIVRVGGDFMHARMLLPSLFGALLPVAVIVATRPQRHLIAAFIVIVSWSIVSICALRPSYHHRSAVQDERAFYAAFSGSEHPVTLHDYRATPWAQDGWALKRLADKRRALIFGLQLGSHPIVSGVPNSSSPVPVVASLTNIGVLGYAAGPKVRIADQGAIADPIASRMRLEALTLPGGIHRPARSRAGHDKLLPAEWMAARFGPTGATAFPGVSLSQSWVIAARQALHCPPIRRLLVAVDSPMTLKHFMADVSDSFNLNGLRFSGNPVLAAHELCSQH